MRRTRHPTGRDSTESALTLQQVVLMLALFGVLAITLQAAQPGWWTTSGAVNSSGATNDYEVANQGQLKHFTQKAVSYLNANLSNGAGLALNNLVSQWSNNYVASNYSATNPAPVDFRVVNIGQVKYIAKLIDSQLTNAGYVGLYPSWLHTNSTDYMAANIGQLKQAFNFDLSVTPGAINGLSVALGAPGEIDLWWSTPPANNANAITVQQSTDGGVTWTTVATLSPTATSYAATNLDTTQNYTYRVNNANGAGTSTTTGTIPLTPPPPPQYAVINLDVPGQPMSFPATINNNGQIAGYFGYPPPENPDLAGPQFFSALPFSGTAVRCRISPISCKSAVWAMTEV